MIKLRDYQHDLIRNTRHALARNKRVLMQAPTGAGKTILACDMIKTTVERNHSAMFLVHQNELLNQTSRALWHNKIGHGMIVSGRASTPHPVQLASIMTLKNRLDKYPEPKLIIIDEAHRSVAKTYQDVLAHYPNSYAVGLTATPQRTDGKGLDHIYQELVQGPSIRYLIETGALCDYELYGVAQKVTLDSVRTTAGDYNAGDSEKELMKKGITGDAIEHYIKYAKGRRCVVMCVTIEHAESVAREYRAAGIPAEAIHGKSKNRDEILERIASGETLVLTSVQLLVEGVDIPQIGCLQWLRPTKSIVVWMQGNGRGLRPHEEKDHLVILDHVGNWQRHGMPCEHREWTLEGDKAQGRRASDPDALGVQTCEKCYFAFRSGIHECPHCGAEVEFKERKIETFEGELEAIKKAEAAEVERKEKRQEQGRARELDELVAIGIGRGMNKPAAWAVRVFAGRQGRKPTGAEYARAQKIEREFRNEQK